MSKLEELEKDIAAVLDKYEIQDKTSIPSNTLASFMVSSIASLKKVQVDMAVNKNEQ